jgi:hypothetical protein
LQKTVKMLGGFFKIPKTKQFHYKPRYYDERKEELDRRIAQIKSEMGITDDEPDENKYFRGDYKPNIKGQMRAYFRQSQSRQKRTSNVRLLVILLVLLALAWYIIYF